MMLADADKDGNVIGDDETIAQAINVTLSEFQEAIKVLSAPDPKSKSKDCDGARVVPLEDIGTGYRLVNYKKWQETATDEQRRDYFKLKKREYREREKGEKAAAQAATPVTAAVRREAVPGKKPVLAPPEEVVDVKRKVADEVADGNRPKNLTEVLMVGDFLGVPFTESGRFFDFYENGAVNGVWMKGEEAVVSWKSLLKVAKENWERKRVAVAGVTPKLPPFNNKNHDNQANKTT